MNFNVKSCEKNPFPLLLSLERVFFSYGNQEILKGVSFALKEGEIASLIGLSGSGKTTLFRLITGLLSPEKGKITIKENPLPFAASQITYLQQEDLLLPWRTVLGNLLLISELGKEKKIESIKHKALALLERVGLKHCSEYYPFQLSGGMRQRVSLARALLQNRPLLLLDEPFESLDVIIREQLYVLLREIRDQFKKTLLFVTHDFRDAVMLSDRILLLIEGKIVEEFSITDSIRNDPHEKENLMESIRKRLDPNCYSNLK